jgi:hypothetical protein
VLFLRKPLPRKNKDNSVVLTLHYHVLSFFAVFASCIYGDYGEDWGSKTFAARATMVFFLTFPQAIVIYVGAIELLTPRKKNLDICNIPGYETFCIVMASLFGAFHCFMIVGTVVFSVCPGTFDKIDVFLSEHAGKNVLRWRYVSSECRASAEGFSGCRVPSWLRCSRCRRRNHGDFDSQGLDEEFQAEIDMTPIVLTSENPDQISETNEQLPPLGSSEPTGTAHAISSAGSNINVGEMHTIW